MTEEDFLLAEQQRRDAERKVLAVKAGAPQPGSLEEFMRGIQAELDANVVLKEFIVRANHDVAEAVKQFFMLPLQQQLKEQAGSMGQVAAELSSLTYKMNELNDNFNVFASKLLSLNVQRLELVRHAVAVLESELNR